MVAGVRQTLGSAAFADSVPDTDDYVVVAIKRAGAVITGKTATPEFGLPCYTETEVGPPALHAVGPVQVRGRIERRRGRRGRGGPGPGRPGQRRRRLHPHPVQRVRSFRDQAVTRPDLRGPAHARPGRPGCQRPHRADRRGRRAAARRDDRKLPRRHVHPAAAPARRVVPGLRQPPARPAADRPDAAEPGRGRRGAPRLHHGLRGGQHPAGQPGPRGRGRHHAARPRRGAVLRDPLVRLRHARPARPRAGGRAPSADPLPARPRAGHQRSRAHLRPGLPAGGDPRRGHRAERLRRHPVPDAGPAPGPGRLLRRGRARRRTSSGRSCSPRSRPSTTCPASRP